MEIKFNCKSCGQRFSVDDSYEGTVVPCPKCGVTLSVPKSTPKETPPRPEIVPPTIAPPTFVPSVTPAPQVVQAKPPFPVAQVPETKGRTKVYDTIQCITWLFCLAVLGLGGGIFGVALINASGASQAEAAGAVFAAFFIGAYVLARTVEKICTLLNRK